MKPAAPGRPRVNSSEPGLGATLAPAVPRRETSAGGTPTSPLEATWHESCSHDGMRSSPNQRLQRQPSKPETRVALKALPRENHVRLDQLFEQLADAVRQTQTRHVARLWPEFEVELLAHLDLEERLVFPHLARLDPAGIESLAWEHAQIRQKLDEISSDLGDHLSQLPSITEFLELLKAHARREDLLMYRWAE